MAGQPLTGLVRLVPVLGLFYRMLTGYAMPRFLLEKGFQKMVKCAGFGRGIRTFLAGEPKKSIEGLANSVALSGNFGLRDSAS